MKNKIYLQSYHTPVGEMVLASYNDALCIANWEYGKTKERIEKKIAKTLNAVYVDASSGGH